MWGFFNYMAVILAINLKRLILTSKALKPTHNHLLQLDFISMVAPDFMAILDTTNHRHRGSAFLKN